MADTKTYKLNDTYRAEYTNPPVSPEVQYKVGQWVSIREEGVLVAMCEVEKTNETGYEGKIVKVFGIKAPARPTDPRKGGPAGNRRTRPL